MANIRKAQGINRLPKVGRLKADDYSEFLPLSERHVVTMRPLKPQDILVFDLAADRLAPSNKLKMENVQAICTDRQQQIVVGANLNNVCVWRRDTAKNTIDKIAEQKLVPNLDHEATGAIHSVKVISHCTGSDYICGALLADKSDVLFCLNYKTSRQHYLMLPQNTRIMDVAFVAKNNKSKLITAEADAGVFRYDIDLAEGVISNRTLLAKPKFAMRCRIDLRGDYLAVGITDKTSKLCVWPLSHDVTLPTQPIMELTSALHSDMQFTSTGSLVFINAMRHPCFATDFHAEAPSIGYFELDDDDENDVAQKMCCLADDTVFWLNEDFFFTHEARNLQNIYQQALLQFNLKISTKEALAYLPVGQPFRLVTQYFRPGFFTKPNANIADEKSERALVAEMITVVMNRLPAEHLDSAALSFFRDHAQNNLDQSIQQCLTATKEQALDKKTNVLKFSQELIDFFNDLAGEFRPKIARIAN